MCLFRTRNWPAFINFIILIQLGDKVELSLCIKSKPVKHITIAKLLVVIVTLLLQYTLVAQLTSFVSLSLKILL